jgi:hypothetical protein
VRHELWRRLLVLQGQDALDVAYTDLRIAWVIRLSLNPFDRLVDALPEGAIEEALLDTPRSSQNPADNLLSMVRRTLAALPSMPATRQKIAAPVLGSLLRRHGETTLLQVSLPHILAPLRPTIAARVRSDLTDSIDLERRYQRAAVAGFKTVLKHTPSPAKPPRGELVYLMAELSRRVEDYDAARRGFEAAATDDTSPDIVRLWAMEQQALLPPPAAL